LSQSQPSRVIDRTSNAANFLDLASISHSIDAEKPLAAPAEQQPAARQVSCADVVTQPLQRDDFAPDAGAAHAQTAGGSHVDASSPCVGDESVVSLGIQSADRRASNASGDELRNFRRISGDGGFAADAGPQSSMLSSRGGRARELAAAVTGHDPRDLRRVRPAAAAGPCNGAVVPDRFKGNLLVLPNEAQHRGSVS
jgi:hypothetical protein